MTKRDAVVEAVKHCEQWMDGAAVVANEDGSFDAIPGAYLTDISYTGSHDVIFRIANLFDFGNVDIDLNETGTLEFIVDDMILHEI